MKALMIAAPENFRDEELFETRKALEENDIEVEIASLIKGELKGKLGGIAQSGMTLEEVDDREFEAIIIVGGGGALIFLNNEVLKNMVEKFWLGKKVVAAICIAPTILSSFGFFVGRKMTVTPGSEEDLIKDGVVVEEADVVSDGALITANGPLSSRQFGTEISKHLLAQ